MSDGSEEEDLDADNYNSAGEEIDEEDFDESQNEGFPRQVDHENDQDILEGKHILTGKRGWERAGWGCREFIYLFIIWACSPSRY